MLRDGRGITIRLVLLLAVAACGFSYLALRLWTGQGGALPPSTWAGLLVLVFMASGVFFAGLPVRRFLRGQATKPLNPIRAMRTLVLAQACALTGAVAAMLENTTCKPAFCEKNRTTGASFSEDLVLID